MSKHGPVFFAYSFDQQGKASKVSSKDVAEEVRNHGLSWVHLDWNHISTSKWLQSKVNYLDQIVINALLADETRPRIVEFKHGILIILRGVSFDEKIKKQDMVSIRLWIDGDRIITIEKRAMNSIRVLQKMIENGLEIQNSGQFLNQLLNYTIEDISKLIYSSGEKIDDVEDEVMETRNLKFRDHILHTRSSLTIFKRYLLPQKETISRIRNCNYHWVDETTIRHFQENYEHISRVVDEIDEVLMRSKILHDELSHALNEKISRNTFKLSIITSIFMPMSFITGIFGMNFVNIPGLKSDFGFYVITALMLILVGIQLRFFKKRDWF